MARLTQRDTAGIWGTGTPRAHEPRRELQQSPPRAVLSDGMNAALGDYAASIQNQNRIERERSELFAIDADDVALLADQQLAATLAPGEEVTTPNLDKLASDRRRAIVGQGGASIACDRAADRAWALRTDDALNPAAVEASDKARAAALALLDKLPPLLDTITAHAAAIQWTKGERYNPNRELQQYVTNLREDLIP